MKIKLVILIYIVLNMCSCKDEFLFESKNYNNELAIEGLISTNEPPYTIKLSIASSVNNLEIIPYEGCIITLFENNKNSEVLTETEPGSYSTSKNGIKGIVGNSYSITVKTPNGEKYFTDPQAMRPPVEIETINTELIYKEDLNYTYGLPGYQFYLSTKTANSSEDYFMWQMEETYQYSNDYILTDYFLGMETIEVGGSVVTQEIRNDTLLDYYNKTVSTCWKTEQVNCIFTGNTANLTVAKINNQPLHFISTESKKLTLRYSLLVKQYSISEEAYYYWKQIEKQSSEDNFLSITQPYTIAGNLKNIKNEKDKTLGYFTVASVNKKRIFVDKPNAPFYYTICYVLTDPVSILDITLHRNPPFYYVQTEIGEGMIDLDCVDCRTKGGTAKKPDFWIDK